MGRETPGVDHTPVPNDSRRKSTHNTVKSGYCSPSEVEVVRGQLEGKGTQRSQIGKHPYGST